MTEHTFTLTQMRAAIKAVHDGGHSVFAPSGSKMWLNCSGSLIPNLFAPDDAGEDAAYGSVGHSVGERWLKEGKRPADMIGQYVWVEAADWGFHIPIDEVMLDHVERYVNWVKFLPGEHFVETRVDFSCLTPIPNQGGTADHVACTFGRMVITDLKMGKGVHVYAKGNTQAMLYALGFFYAWDWWYDFQEFEIRIAQPRRDNMDVWIITRAELLAFAAHVKTRASAAWVQNAPRTPSAEACQWCRVQATCAAKAKAVIDMTEGAFDGVGEEVSEVAMSDFKARLSNDNAPLSMVNPLELSTYELEKLYDWRSTVERFFSKVGDELLIRANKGEKLKLQKLVESRTFRAFRSKAQAVKTLVKLGLDKNEVLVEELVSPAKAEELLRKIGFKTKELKTLLNDLVIRPPGKVTLTSIKDKRASVNERDGDAFSEFEVSQDL